MIALVSFTKHYLFALLAKAFLLVAACNMYMQFHHFTDKTYKLDFIMSFLTPIKMYMLRNLSGEK